MQCITTGTQLPSECRRAGPFASLRLSLSCVYFSCLPPSLLHLSPSPPPSPPLSPSPLARAQPQPESPRLSRSTPRSLFRSSAAICAANRRQLRSLFSLSLDRRQSAETACVQILEVRNFRDPIGFNYNEKEFFSGGERRGIQRPKATASNPFQSIFLDISRT